LKIFLSSVIRGFEPFRDAAGRAIGSLGFELLRSERFSASPDAPRRACLAEVRAADAVVLLLGARYGTIQDSGLSATHEEYREARERCLVFVFVQDGVNMEDRQRGFLEETEAWGSGHLTARFRDQDGLRDQVTEALHRWHVAQVAGSTDIEELRSRAARLVPPGRTFSNAKIYVVTVGGPRQAVLRPARVDDPGFRRELQREATYGASAVLDPDAATAARVQDDALTIEQEYASLLIAPDGSIRVMQGGRRASDRGYELPVLVEEHVHGLIRRGLEFANTLLDQVDPERRLSDILPVVACANAGHYGWQTEAEHRTSGGSIQIGIGRTDLVQLELAPPVIKRGALGQRVEELARDFTVLLRRRMKP